MRARLCVCVRACVRASDCGGRRKGSKNNPSIKERGRQREGEGEGEGVRMRPMRVTLCPHAHYSCGGGVWPKRGPRAVWLWLWRWL